MPLRSLSDNATSTLISIDAKHGVYAAQAKDLLQAAQWPSDLQTKHEC